MALVNHDESYRVWIPGFEPKPLYYAGLTPADKMYMLVPAFQNDAGLSASYENILTNDKILVYPGLSRSIPDKLRQRFSEKVNRQFRGIPTDAYDVETVVQRKVESKDNTYYQYIKVNRFNGPIVQDIKLTGVVNRGYQYAFFLENTSTSKLSNHAYLEIKLEDQKGNTVYETCAFLNKAELADESLQLIRPWRLGTALPIKVHRSGTQMRVDWEIPRLMPDIINKKCDMIIEIETPEANQEYPIRIPFVS